MKKLRIGYITYGLDRPLTGIGRYSVELLKMLKRLQAKENIEIVLLTTEREDRQQLWSGVERHSLPFCRRLPQLMTLGNPLLSLATHRYKLDVIHDPNGIAPFLSPAMGAGRVVTLYDAFSYTTPETHNRLDNWRYRHMLPRSVRGADAVLTISECSRADLLQYLPVSEKRISLAPCGIDPFFHPISSEETSTILQSYGATEPYVLYIGSVNARKNVVRLVEAFAKVREQRPDLTLIIGGTRGMGSSIIDEVMKKQDLEHSVIFTGYVRDRDLPALYSGAALFCFPSLYEGFGLPPLEAMACGTPALVSNVSSMPGVVGDAAVLVDPLDVSSIASGMLRVLDDKAFAAELTRRGLIRAADFTWEHTAEKTVLAYRKAESLAVSRHPVGVQRKHVSNE